jgi:hypothetical protein
MFNQYIYNSKGIGVIKETELKEMMTEEGKTFRDHLLLYLEIFAPAHAVKL